MQSGSVTLALPHSPRLRPSYTLHLSNNTAGTARVTSSVTQACGMQKVQSAVVPQFRQTVRRSVIAELSRREKLAVNVEQIMSFYFMQNRLKSLNPLFQYTAFITFTIFCHYT